MREYFITQVLGKLYAVRCFNGSESVTVFEGAYDECAKWIDNSQ